MRQFVTSALGRRNLAIIVVLALLSVPLSRSWLSGLVLGVVLLLGQWGVWRGRVARSLRQGYDVGDGISVGYLESEEFRVIDRTGELLLPRGSAMVVFRRGGVVTIVGRSICFLLPSELLTDGDAAFLEGHGEVPQTPQAPTPPFSLALEVTPAVQQSLVDARTRAIATSADFLMTTIFAILIVVFVASFSPPWRVMTGVVVFVVACALPQLRVLSTNRRLMRIVFPIGYTIRAEADAEHLSVTSPHRTVRVPWHAYKARRVTDRSVFLRLDRRKPGNTQILPRELFSEEALAQMSAHVPRTF